MAGALVCLVTGMKDQPLLLVPALVLLGFFIWWEGTRATR